MYSHINERMQRIANEIDNITVELKRQNEEITRIEKESGKLIEMMRAMTLKLKSQNENTKYS